MRAIVSPMKILHIASFNRWSGAAAPAFAEADALRRAGIEAQYAYVGGYLLEEKIGRLDWAHPILVEGEDPISVIRNLRAIRTLVEAQRFDVVHSHLTHDHWLAALALTGQRSVSLVRTFHAVRALKTDPLSRRLFGRTGALAVVNPTLSGHPALRGRSAIVTPSPLESLYSPSGPSARSAYGIPAEAPVIGVIGKVSPGRGFEDAIETFARIRPNQPDARLLIVGRGPHRPDLEALADRVGVAGAVIWAGYHEDDLAEHFRTMDVLLFTAAGSDEGHRAITEANACGTPAAAYPVPGVEYVVGQHADELVSSAPTPESLAAIVERILAGKLPDIRARVAENAARFDYRSAVDRLLMLYELALRG